VFEDVLDHQSLNTRTAALRPSVSQCRPELDMNFEISKSEHPHGKGYVIWLVLILVGFDRPLIA
jgi:hypothetical protein